MLKNKLIFLGSFIGSAFWYKKAPGTVSTFFSAILFYVTKVFFIDQLYTIGIIELILLIVSYFSLKSFKEKDPKFFTLDEVFVAFNLILFFHNSLIVYISSIILFRFFDIFKPLGIKFLEKSKYLSRYWQVMLDDVLAGIYTIIVVLLSLAILKWD